jgi:hypothetical protein
VVLADGFLAPVVEAVYDAHDKVPGMLDSWVATLAFSGQIFCDFAGYSTSAIGIALCLGFAMPDNFRFPYGAVGFSDFWRRPKSLRPTCVNNTTNLVAFRTAKSQAGAEMQPHGRARSPR